MAIHLPSFLLALALLLFPRGWMRIGAVVRRRRSSAAARAREAEPWNKRSPGDPRVSGRREFRRLRNYIDLLRAGGGGALLMGEFGLVAAIAAESGASSLAARAVVGVRALIFVIGLLVQTLRWEHGRVTFYPPVFYIAGVSVALCSPWAALFAFILIWTVSGSLPNAQGFLALYAGLILLFGHLLLGLRDLSTDFAALLCFLPVLLSWMSNKPLVVLTRKGTHGAAG